MKTTHTFLLLIFAICTLSSFQAKSQAKVIFDEEITFDDLQGGVFPAIDSKITLSASGHIVKTATFQLPQDHFLVPDKGYYHIGVEIVETNIFGEAITMYDFMVLIDKNGKFKITVHSNGAGNIFPAVFKD